MHGVGIAARVDQVTRGAFVVKPGRGIPDVYSRTVRIGLLTDALESLSLDETVDWCAARGIGTIRRPRRS